MAQKISTPYLERVLVDQVEGVPGELGATTGVAADQIGVLVACSPADQPPIKFRGEKNIRTICQIRSLETLVRSAAMMTDLGSKGIEIDFKTRDFWCVKHFL